MDVNAWLVAGVGTAVVLVAVTLLVAVVTATALASWGRFPVWVGVLVCAVVPLVGPLVLTVVALVRAGRDAGRPTWLERGRWTVRGMPIAGRRVRLGVLAAGLLALAALLVVPIARLHAGAAFSSPVLLTALPPGGALLGGTFLASLLVAAAAARRTTRLGAVGAAMIGGLWTAAAGSALLLSVPLSGVLRIADHYIGNALGGLVLSLLRSYDVPAAAIASDLRESVSTRLDAGVWVALAGGLLLLAWSVVEVVSGYRAAAARAAVPAVPTTTTAAPPVPTADVWTF